MSKVILLSAVLAIVALPVIAAKSKNPKAGLKKALIYLVVFNVCYLLALRFVIKGV
jgi:hypothetical protein